MIKKCLLSSPTQFVHESSSTQLDLMYDCTFDELSANYSLSPYFDSYDFLSIATSKGETSFFDLNVLSYVEELLN